jgi:hypothetical protein
MKRTSLVLLWSLVVLVCLGTFAAAGSASSARNDCKDRCKDRYNLRKDICKAIPYKRQRRVCEDAAKQTRNECKRACR